MKVITLNADNRSILIAEDADAVSLEVDHVKRNDDRIYGLPKDKVTLHEGVDVPADWSPSRYIFDGTSWTQNPDWVDPAALLNG